MFRVTLTGVLLLSMAGTLAAQSGPEIVRTWNVSWRDVSDPLGNHRTVAVLGWAGSEPPKAHVRYTAPPQISIVATLEEEFRTARQSSNAGALSRILSDGFLGTNQNGDTHNKAEIMERTRSSKIRSVVTSATITSSDTTVIITGDETDVNYSGAEQLLFSRVYVQEPSREWKLLTSTQFRRR
jgi:hypothetical protein